MKLRTDPETGNHLHPATGAELKLTDRQLRAEDPEFRARNPARALLDEWTPNKPDGSIHRFTHPATYGNALRKTMLSGDRTPMAQIARLGSIPGALAYGIPAGLVGAGGAAAFRAVSGRDSMSPIKAGILAALLGAGYGALSGRLHKHSSFGGDLRVIQAKLDADNTLSFPIRQRLKQKAEELPQGELQALARQVAPLGAGAAAALVSRYLLRTGLVTSALFGVGVGTFTRRMQEPRDAFGRRSHQGRDIFGRSLWN